MRSALIVTFATTLLGTAAPALAAQEAAPDGEQVYRQHCARCHEGSMPRMPTRELLRQRTPEDVEIALSTFTMRRQGAALSSAERRAVSEYVTGRPPGSYRDPLDVIAESAYCRAPVGAGDPLAGPAWNGWGAGLRNTRFQSAEAAGLTPDDVPRLTLKWAFGFPGVSASGSQATVVGGRVFVGSRNGLVYGPPTPRAAASTGSSRPTAASGPPRRSGRIPAAARRSSTSATRSPTSTRSTSRAATRAGRCRSTTTATR